MNSYFQTLYDILIYSTAHLFLLFFLCLWAKWLIIAAISTRYKPYQSSGDPRTLSAEMERLAVVIPVLGEDPSLFREVLKRVSAELPGKLVVVINGPRDENLEQICDQLTITWIYTARSGKRHAVKLGVDWILKNFPESKYIALLDSDTLLTQGSLSELVKAFLADEQVGGVCGTQRINDPGRSWVARFADWIEDYYQANYWPAFSYLGQIGCLWGRCVVYRQEVIAEGMKTFLDQRVLGVRIEIGDDRYLTTIALQMGYKTVFQSTSCAYTSAHDSLRKLVRQHLRWARGDQAYNLVQFGWLWRKKIPLAGMLTGDYLLQPFFLLAVLVNTLFNLANGHAVLLPFLGVAFMFFGLTNVSRLRTHKRDILALPVFITLVTFLVLPIQAWGLATCSSDKGWMTRGGGCSNSKNNQAYGFKLFPLLIALVLAIAAVLFGYLTSTFHC